jgi:hypothetical protein
MTRIKPSLREKGKCEVKDFFQRELRAWSFWTPQSTGTHVHRLPVIVAMSSGVRGTRKPLRTSSAKSSLGSMTVRQ